MNKTKSDLALLDYKRKISFKRHRLINKNFHLRLKPSIIYKKTKRSNKFNSNNRKKKKHIIIPYLLVKNLYNKINLKAIYLKNVKKILKEKLKKETKLKRLNLNKYNPVNKLIAKKKKLGRVKLQSKFHLKIFIINNIIKSSLKFLKKRTKKTKMKVIKNLKKVKNNISNKQVKKYNLTSYLQKKLKRKQLNIRKKIKLILIQFKINSFNLDYKKFNTKLLKKKLIKLKKNENRLLILVGINIYI